MKRLAAVLLFAAILFARIVPAAAQVQTYHYTGPAYSASFCESYTGLGSPPCVSGSLTASMTFTGVPAGYSGPVGSNQVVSWSMNANGVGSLNTSNYLNTGATGFTLTNGQITSWAFAGAADYIGHATPYIFSQSGSECPSRNILNRMNRL
jgi:hypothetical protein